MAATKPFYLPETVTRFSRLKLLPSRVLSTFTTWLRPMTRNHGHLQFGGMGFCALSSRSRAHPSSDGPWLCFFFSTPLPSRQIDFLLQPASARVQGDGGCGCGCGCRPRALKRHHGDPFCKREPDLVPSQQYLGRFAPDCQPGSTRFPLNPEAGIQGPPTKETTTKGPWDSVWCADTSSRRRHQISLMAGPGCGTLSAISPCPRPSLGPYEGHGRWGIYVPLNPYCTVCLCD